MTGTDRRSVSMTIMSDSVTIKPEPARITQHEKLTSRYI